MMAIRNTKVLFFTFLLSFSAWGQLLKKSLTPDDYHLWSKMDITGVSKNAAWVSYSLGYQNAADTLFVINKYGTKSFHFPKGSGGRFIGEKRFVCMLPENTLALLDMETGKISFKNGILQYSLIPEDYLITLASDGTLQVTNLDGRAIFNHDAVSVYSLDPKNEKLLLGGDFGIMWLDLKSWSTGSVIKAFGGKPSDILWQEQGKSFLFVRQYTDTTQGTTGRNLSFFRWSDKQLFELRSDDLPEIWSVLPPFTTQAGISNDQETIFFRVTAYNSNHALQDGDVEIWNGNDRITHRQKNLLGAGEKATLVALWHLSSGQVKPVTDAALPKAMLTGDKKYAIGWNPVGNRPQAKFYRDMDYYLKDIQNDTAAYILKDQDGGRYSVTPSPGGKYLAYKNNTGWFLYDPVGKKHRKLTGLAYDSSEDEQDGSEKQLELVGWTINDASALFYDAYDLWSIDCGSGKALRMTKGREKQITYRIAWPQGKQDRTMDFDGFMFPVLQLKEGLLLHGFGAKSKKSGYFWWDGKEKLLAYEDMMLSQANYDPKTHTLTAMAQSYESPPSIVQWKKGKRMILFSSNTHALKYAAHKPKLISYPDQEGNDLQGILYYPDDYSPQKTYPMVVYIYEQLSNTLHEYTNPSLLNFTGFNLKNLTAEGYFVLLPDIAYIQGNTGISAAYCVIAATRKAIETAPIDPGRIALVGHSFGGYEAAFIATQTDMFKTIVAGAAVTDMVSYYLTLGWNTGNPDMWRFEAGQWRMQKPLYDNIQGYLSNSTIMHAGKINTPLLLWLGKEDRQVDSRQGMELYLALRRLGKKEIMLMYPIEGHILLDPRHQADFTQKLEEWLGHYLKGKPMAKWMESGLEE